MTIYTTKFPSISEVGVNGSYKSGLQIQSMEFIAKYLDKKIIYAESFKMDGRPFSFQWKRGVPYLGYLNYAPIPDLTFLESFHLSSFTTVDKYILTVPVNFEVIPLWMNMLFIFRWDLWITCLVVYLSMAMSIWFRIKFYKSMSVAWKPWMRKFSFGRILMGLLQFNLGMWTLFTFTHLPSGVF